MKHFLALLISFSFAFALTAEAKRLHVEDVYNVKWCAAMGGLWKRSDTVQISNGLRVYPDCLTDDHAIEFDFIDKWYEGGMQALHYSRLTGLPPLVVIIIEPPQKIPVSWKGDRVGYMEYWEARIINKKKEIEATYNRNCPRIEVEYITPYDIE